MNQTQRFEIASVFDMANIHPASEHLYNAKPWGNPLYGLLPLTLRLLAFSLRIRWHNGKCECILLLHSRLLR